MDTDAAVSGVGGCANDAALALSIRRAITGERCINARPTSRMWELQTSSTIWVALRRRTIEDIACSMATRGAPSGMLISFQARIAASMAEQSS